MPLTRERPRTPVFLPLPAPLPSLSDALARRAAVFGPFDLDDLPVAPRGPWQASALQSTADVLHVDVDHLGTGSIALDRHRSDGPSTHSWMLRQHHLGRALGFALAVLGLVAALACHLRLPGSSWSA